MQLTRYTSPAAFRDRAEAFLMARETEHNLILGLMNVLVVDPSRYPEPPYLATVEANGAVIAAALMTPPHQLTLSWTDHPEALLLIAQDVRDFRPDLPSVTGVAQLSLRFAEAWRDLTGRAFRKRTPERLYRLDQVNPIAPASGQPRWVTPTDRDLLIQWLMEFQQEAMGNASLEQTQRNVTNLLTAPATLRGMGLWEDAGQVVTLTGYGGPTPNSMRIGPVYTPPAFRRKGYATALVAYISQHLLTTGRQFCTLFTDLGNPTSNHIYQVIGYYPVSDIDVYEFVQTV